MTLLLAYSCACPLKHQLSPHCVCLWKITRQNKKECKLTSVDYILWSGSCLSALCSLCNPSQCKTAYRYPCPAGPVIQTLNPLTDCFRWVRPQRQLAAATDSWFVPDFMVQERPTPLSARGITERDKWHHVCIWEQLLLLPTLHHSIRPADLNTVRVKTTPVYWKWKKYCWKMWGDQSLRTGLSCWWLN